MLCVGALGADPYARLTAPYYEALAALVARSHPWVVTGIDVGADGNHPGLFLRLHGDVHRLGNAAAAARVVTRVQAGGVIEAPLIFWTIVLAWPRRTLRARLLLLACAIPMAIALDGITTVCQLLNGFAEASAVIAGNPNPLTPWERWSRFIESGGRDVLALCGALATLALAPRPDSSAAAR